MDVTDLVWLEGIAMELHATGLMVMLIVVELFVAPPAGVRRRYSLAVQLGLPGSAARLSPEDVSAFARWWWWMRAWIVFAVAGLACVLGLQLAVDRALTTAM
jgi:hypothetical protein